MMYLPKTSLTGALLIASVLLHTCCVDSVSIRQHKLKENEPEGRRKNTYLVPNPDMVKALEYIESLRQQTNDEESFPDYDDIERFRSLLRFAPIQNTEDTDQSLVQDMKGEGQDSKSQWFKILLGALQQVEKESRTAPKGTRTHYAFNNRQYPEEDTLTDDVGDYGGNAWPDRSKPLRTQKLLFEDEDSRESPYKRTNEMVEEQYSPQTLATLESVFQELGKLSTPNNHKRERLDDEHTFYKDNEDEMYRENNLAYEDVTGGEDWNPIEEKVEAQQTEEEKESKEEFDKSSDEIDGEVKRASQPSYKENKDSDSDDLTKLVDYYLFKMLEKSERNDETTEKSERQKEGQNTEKRTAWPLGPYNNIGTQAIYKLIEISRRLQIPPEDLIEMLKNGDLKKQDTLLETEVEPEVPDDLDKIEEKQSQIASYNKESKPYSSRRLTDILPEDIPDDLNTEDILNILGLDSRGNQNQKYILKQLNSNRRHGEYILSEPSWVPDDSYKRQVDYDETTEEDDFGNYLAQLLAKYPKIINTKNVKRTHQSSSNEDQVAYGAYEQAMKDYFDQISSSDKMSPVKRLSGAGEKDEANKMQHLDEDMLLKMLEYLNQDTEENDDRELHGKTANAM
ncbi:secretogranin-2-like [Acipenser oxyrinchus oxyrinchus]|uniref:Secretogranin-2-like n=1 Tax=Acipenser oxyrinchus oxyrinchus TaxID=40147 RepID=A0AAD8FYZ5_ACIOX|nr:secretogranin-2-like [Acipenser oxyrinchus oxyrinchus]